MDGATPITTDKPAVAMINVMMDGDYQFDEEIPLGVGMITATLRQHGFPVIVHQCLANKGKDQVEIASAVEADVYGFQLNMVNYLNVRKVVETIKNRNPDAIIVLGGPFLAALAEPILKNEPLFDCIVVGEGEMTMLELVEKAEEANGAPMDFASVSGILWRDDKGNVVRNSLRPLIRDLDVLPFPARDFLKYSDNHDEVDGGLLESVRIITSRGCVAQCNFCAVNFYTKLQKGKLWRGRTPKSVVDEIESLNEQYGATVFNFSDSSFDDPGRKGKERTREICDEIKIRDLKISAKVYMRADSMLADEDVDLLKHWKSAGIDVIIVGAEAGSDFELEFYEKRANLDENYRTIRRLKELGLFYVPVGMIMFGPNSTMETLRQNANFLKDLGLADNPTQMSNVLMLVRDSKLYDILKEEDRILDADNYWELPKFVWKSEKAKRTASHWDGVYHRFPVTDTLNKSLVNMENLLSRMINPMNAEILNMVEETFVDVKSRYFSLKEEFGARQYDYFNQLLDYVDAGRSDEDLEDMAKGFFGGEYHEWLPRYQELHESLLAKIFETKLGRSGLMFRHFRPAVVNEGVKRV